MTVVGEMTAFVNRRISEKKLVSVVEVDEIEGSSCQSEVFDAIHNLTAFVALNCKMSRMWTKKYWMKVRLILLLPNTVNVIRTNDNNGALVVSENMTKEP